MGGRLDWGSPLRRNCAWRQAGFPTRVNLTLALLKVAGILLFVPRYGYLAGAALLAAFYLAGTAITVWKVYSLLPRTAEAR